MKKVQQLAPLETLLYRKTRGRSGLNVCVGVCVRSLCIYIYALLCRNERRKGQESQTLTERESLYDCWLYVCELVIDLLPLAEVLE